MSGPKVVRVLTKQERMAICQRRINAVRDEINEWRKFAARCDALSHEEENEVEFRFNNIKKLLINEKFDEVERQCAAEIVSIRQDMNRIRKELIEKAENEKRVRRNLQYAAETLMHKLSTTDTVIPEELKEIASSVLEVQADRLSFMGKIINKLLLDCSLSASETQKLTSSQNELLESMSVGNVIQTVMDWKLGQDKDFYYGDDVRRLDRLMAEVEALENMEIAKPFLDRIITINKEPLMNRRSLLIDSLIIDLISHLKGRKEIENILSDLREMRSEMRSLNSKAARDLEVILTEAIDTQNVTNSHILIDRCLKLIETEMKKLASDSRRHAILIGLAKLGYEVHENMETAWVKDGRIIVKKPNEKNYGIELGTTTDVDRVQVQLVTFDQPNESLSTSKDCDRELIWCNEFDQLGVLLKESGTELKVEKALPVGAKPLKRIKQSSKNNSKNSTNILKNIKNEKDQ